jgi:hypothetical protein
MNIFLDHLTYMELVASHAGKEYCISARLSLCINGGILVVAYYGNFVEHDNC